MTRTSMAVRTLVALATVALLAAVPAGAIASGKSQAKVTPTASYPSSVTWNGYGAKTDGTGTLVPKDSECAPDEDAPVEGPYLLFKLGKAKYLSDVTIRFGESEPVTMTRKGGYYTYLYTASSIDLQAIRDAGVTASFTASKAVAPKLKLKEGCLGAGGTPITVQFLGDATFGSFANLNSSFGLGQVVSVCQNGSATNCVTFSGSAAPGTTGTLTLPSPSTLDLTTSGTSGCVAAMYGSAVTVATIGSVTPELYALPLSTVTTTTPESAPRTVYVVTACGG